MKLCADENIAPKLSAMIREQLCSRDFLLETVDDHAAKGVDDQIWVRNFAKAGGEAVVSGDAAMTKKHHEVLAIHETGLRLVVLDERWARQKKHLQIAYLFFWWPSIEEVLRTARQGQCFKVPWAWPADPSARSIKALSLDVQEAYRKLKRRG